jgi:uncharacterized protein
VINNWDAETRQFKYSDDRLFDPGTEVELKLGYYGKPLESMMAGEITELRPAFPAGGQPTLTISGLNVLHRFRKEQRSDTYIDKTDYQIASEIARRIGADIETIGQAGPSHAYLIQDNTYDIVFLMDRARANDYELTLDAASGKLKFGPSDRQKRSVYELIYGRTLIEFQPSLTTAHQVGAVTVRGWDPFKKKKIEHTATADDLAAAGLDADTIRAIEKSYSGRKEVVATQIVESEQEAERLAVQTLQQIAKGLVTASGSTVGLPQLRAGGVVMVGGLGDRFSGRYYITDTSHTVGDSGYSTQFNCRREEVKTA